MKTLTQYTFLIAFFCLFVGCKRSTNNPCEGLMNESPPLRIGVMLIDRQTGNNLIQTNALKAEDIKVTIAQTGSTFNDWRIINTTNSPFNGMLEFTAFHEKAAEYAYKIELKNLGTVNLSYTIKQEKTNDPCKMYYYPMEGLKVSGHDFEPFKYEDKTYPNVVVVTLN